MARKQAFSNQMVFAAVGKIVAERGSITTTSLQQELGMSTGSLYHRFASREALLARTWCHALTSFSHLFIAALADPKSTPGAIAAVTPHFCRTHRSEALVLAVCNRNQFVGSEVPVDILVEIDGINRSITLAMSQYANLNGYDPETCRIAFMAFPLGAVQLYLPSATVPEAIDRAVIKAAEAILMKIDLSLDR